MIVRRIAGGRLHLQHGPIDLVIGAEGDREAAFAAAAARFDGLLERLVAELPRLRAPSGTPVTGPVARRMVAAVAPHHIRGFVTPMAAVAGAVAEEVLAAMEGIAVTRAYVNNGGDIALRLEAGARYETLIAGPEGQALGRISIAAEDPVRGIATSGQGGRSFSLGIAESVTVLAKSAAAADVAATLIGNAVDLPGHAAIRRVRACELAPDSDLGARPVVSSVGALLDDEVARALRRGAVAAEDMLARGLILSAALFLRGQSVTLGETSCVRGLSHA